MFLHKSVDNHTDNYTIKHDDNYADYRADRRDVKHADKHADKHVHYRADKRDVNHADKHADYRADRRDAKHADNHAINQAKQIEVSGHRYRAIPQYIFYSVRGREYVVTVIAAMLAVYCFVFVFYHSHIVSMIFSPLGFLYPKMRGKNIAEKKRTELKQQFRDMLYSMSSSLMAGKPLESAFMDIRDDLEILYPDEETPIRIEIGIILRRIALNESAEDALNDLAERSKIDDIESFCNVISTCRRTGGNLVDIVKNTSNIIGDKLEIKQEIDIMLASRRFEKKILNVMPVALILILTFFAGDYMEPVFTTLTGRIIITLSVLIMLISWLIADKIAEIKI